MNILTLICTGRMQLDIQFSNYDRSCVYSNSTVDAAAHYFTDVIMQATVLAIFLVPLHSTNSFAGFLTH